MTLFEKAEISLAQQAEEREAVAAALKEMELTLPLLVTELQATHVVVTQ